LKNLLEKGNENELWQGAQISRVFFPPHYLHPAQDDAEQPPHPEPDDEEDESLEPLPKPNFESRFSVFRDPHFGQTTSGF
jgi:hypothetical protein